MNSKNRVLAIFENIDSEFKDLKREADEDKQRAADYFTQLCEYSDRYNTFITALNKKLLPKVLENDSIMETWEECFELLKPKENG